MALTPQQKTTVVRLLDGDHTINAPLLGVEDFLRDLTLARDAMRAVLTLDASGSVSPTLMDELHAARTRAIEGCKGMTKLLTAGG